MFATSTGQYEGDLSPVIVTWASKGGTGKTSVSLSVAAAAAAAGMRVILVDMNRGQGDVRKYLRLSREQTLYTVYDAALAKSPKAAIVSPTKITDARHSSLPPVKFGIGFAPRQGQSDPKVVSTEFYRRVIEEARKAADLVIVDTQIAEDTDTSDLIDGLAIPLVRSHGGWALAVTDASLPGVDNTVTNMAKFDVGRERMLYILNKVPEGSDLNPETLERFMQGRATVMGMVGLDDEFVSLTNSGRFGNDHDEMGKVVARVLERVTGRDGFTSKTRKPDGAKPKRGLFGRKKR